MTTVEQPTRATSQYRKSFFAILIGFVLLFLLLDRTPLLVASQDPTVGFLVASAVLVIAAIGLDMLLFRRTLPSAWRNLGLGRPEARTLVVTTLIGVLMMGFFPVFSWVTGASIVLPEYWL